MTLEQAARNRLRVRLPVWHPKKYVIPAVVVAGRVTHVLKFNREFQKKAGHPTPSLTHSDMFPGTYKSKYFEPYTGPRDQNDHLP